MHRLFRRRDISSDPTPIPYSSSSSDGSAIHTPDPDDDQDACPPPPPRPSRWSSWLKVKSTPPKPSPVWLPPVTATVNPDSDDDDDSDNYGDDGVVQPAPPAPPAPRVLQPATALRAQMNLRAITLAALIPPISPPPLLHLPSAPLFPRSTNPTRSLKPLQSTRTSMLRSTLLRRLEAHTLSHHELDSIAPLGHRPKHQVPTSRRRTIDDEALSDVKKVSLFSRGAQQWIHRPCFEERCLLWSWDSSRQVLVSRSIPGSHRAVASLEFSEHMEALAGYPVEPTLTGDSAPTVPAPLVIPPLDARAPSSTTTSPAGPPTPVTAPILAVPRKPKVLRFLPDPDDPEDTVPLGVQVLTKRERERVAEERVRLAREEAQKRRIQAEEEEERKRMYAAEVIAARARREGARGGSNSHEAEVGRAKDRRQSYARPAYDPSRRSASEVDNALVVDAGGGGKSRPASLRSERMSTTHVSAPIPSPSQPSPPTYARSQTMPVDELQDAKMRRRMSNFSEGNTSARAKSGTQPLPRSLSAGPGSIRMPSGMAPMQMPVPPLPMMPMSMFVMPSPGPYSPAMSPAGGVPQFYMQQPLPVLPPLPLQPPHPPARPRTERSSTGTVAHSTGGYASASGNETSRHARPHRAASAHPTSPGPGAGTHRSSGGGTRRASGEDVNTGTRRMSRAVSATTLVPPPVSYRQAPLAAGGRPGPGASSRATSGSVSRVR